MGARPSPERRTPGANLTLGKQHCQALWAPTTHPVAGQRSACQAGSPRVTHPTGLAQTTPSAIRGQEVWVSLLHPPRGKELPPQVSPRNTNIETGTGPRLTNRAAGRAGAWGGPGASQRRLRLHTRWPAARPVWTEAVGARQPVPTAAPGLNTPAPALTPETGVHSMRPSHPARQAQLEVLSGRGGRAPVPDLPSQGGWRRAIVSSASQEGLRPDCSKAPRPVPPQS